MPAPWLSESNSASGRVLTISPRSGFSADPVAGRIGNQRLHPTVKGEYELGRSPHGLPDSRGRSSWSAGPGIRIKCLGYILCRFLHQERMLSRDGVALRPTFIAGKLGAAGRGPSRRLRKKTSDRLGPAVWIAIRIRENVPNGITFQCNGNGGNSFFVRKP